jgi:hypothetical protein
LNFRTVFFSLRAALQFDAAGKTHPRKDSSRWWTQAGSAMQWSSTSLTLPPAAASMIPGLPAMRAAAAACEMIMTNQQMRVADVRKAAKKKRKHLPI